MSECVPTAAIIYKCVINIIFIITLLHHIVNELQITIIAIWSRTQWAREQENGESEGWDPSRPETIPRHVNPWPAYPGVFVALCCLAALVSQLASRILGGRRERAQVVVQSRVVHSQLYSLFSQYHSSFIGFTGPFFFVWLAQSSQQTRLLSFSLSSFHRGSSHRRALTLSLSLSPSLS